jgi:hypothetical protein
MAGLDDFFFVPNQGPETDGEILHKLSDALLGTTTLSKPRVSKKVSPHLGSGIAKLHDYLISHTGR